jgi:cysteine-rich repeat protein
MIEKHRRGATARLFFACALVIAQATPAHAFVIDSYDTPQFLNQTGVGSNADATDLTTGTILGDERDVLITVTTGAGPLNADADLSLMGGFSHMAAGLVRGTTLITYDGNDSDGDTLDPTGLGGIDLSNGGGDGAFYVVVPFADHGAGIVITVYSGATNCSTLSRTVPAGLAANDFPLALVFPFADFVDGGGCTAADFSDAGAITLLIDGTALGAIDASLDVFATGNADLGDLPPAFNNTENADNGAAHVICPGLKLGAEIDAEDDGQESADATGDDTAGSPDDEDGVILTPAFVWSVGSPPTNGGQLDITVMGDGCLSAWIDWTADNSFDDAGEAVLSNVTVSAGTASYQITIPGGTALPGTYFARFRLFARDDPNGANNCSTQKDPVGQYECGEVEDYRFTIEIPTPTPTVTPTQTPTRTHTLTPTPTPQCGNGIEEFGEQCDDGNLVDNDGCDSNCRPTGCGNGIVTMGEQCDDGNLIDFDGCNSDCTPSECTFAGGDLIPGYCATRKNDCQAEFCSATKPVETDRFNGLPGMDVVCTDDDPACDVGPANDGACTFRVSLCYNVEDTRFPCTDTGAVGFVRFRRANPHNAVDVANRNALEAAVVGIGGVLKVGRGIPGRRAVFFEPPLEQDVCTGFAEFKVPLRGNAPNFKTRRKLLVHVADPPPGISRAKRDSDVLRLICNPK